MTVDKTLFVLYGTWNTGKTTTITKTRDLLMKLPDATKTEYKPDAPDFTCIIKVGGIRIGIVSDGDVPGNVRNAIKSFQDKNCHVIICACRTRKTKGSAREYIDTLSGCYNSYWFRTSTIYNARWLANEKERECKTYNHDTAKVIVGMIKRRINANRQ
ncbi:hypothetical protein [Candidatus Spongiihabitans sp.]|uniref:hypothetical protein n=1 Tax=Candidatus Spongiihabitans sp. TaxID=3101308 RepID=UPI003C6EFBD6